MAAPDAPSAAVAELRAASRIYRGAVDARVLDAVDLAVHAGEFAALVGASGSGKTTALNLLGLLDQPSEGQVFVAGVDAGGLEEDARSALRRDHIGFVFQFHHLLPDFDVLENCLMPCRLRGEDPGGPARARVLELLHEVGLDDHRGKRPNQLSGGQQQRAALVRALANEPALLLADEPTGNLDSHSRDQVFDLLRQLARARSLAVLMVTHDATLAQAAERIITIADGRILSDQRRSGG